MEACHRLIDAISMDDGCLYSLLLIVKPSPYSWASTRPAPLLLLGLYSSWASTPPGPLLLLGLYSSRVSTPEPLCLQAPIHPAPTRPAPTRPSPTCPFPTCPFPTRPFPTRPAPVNIWKSACDISCDCITYTPTAPPEPAQFVAGSQDGRVFVALAQINAPDKMFAINRQPFLGISFFPMTM